MWKCAEIVGYHLYKIFGTETKLHTLCEIFLSATEDKMVIQIEIRKIEKTFGKDRWAIRIGDIAGSIDIHNCSRTELTKTIIDEIDEEAKRLSDDETNKIILSEVFDKFVYDELIAVEKEYQGGTVNSALYTFKEKLKKKLNADKKTTYTKGHTSHNTD